MEIRNLKEPELRAVFGVELRVKPDSRVLEGTAIPYGKRSVKLWDFYEEFKVGALRDFLASKPEVYLLHDHDSAKTLARSGVNMEVYEDDKGVHFTTQDLPNTTYANDVLELVRTKVVSNMSFGFYEATSDWREEPNGDWIRIVTSAKIRELTITAFPAYPQTSVSARSALADHLDKLQKFKETEEKRLESLKKLIG